MSPSENLNLDLTELVYTEESYKRLSREEKIEIITADYMRLLREAYDALSGNYYPLRNIENYLIAETLVKGFPSAVVYGVSEEEKSPNNKW